MTTIIGSARFRAPSAPSVTPGIQHANAEPSRCFEASQGNAPTTPFRIGSSKEVSARQLAHQYQRRTNDQLVPGFSEDCLFLKYVLSSHSDVAYYAYIQILSPLCHLVFTFLGN